jgi:hypothetical protein
MITILAWSAFALLAGLVFLVLLIMGIAQRRMALVLVAVAALLVSIGLSCVAVYHVMYKSAARVSEAFAPRSGITIYEGFFGAAPAACVTVTHHRDQVIPKIDTGIDLHMRICPAEVRRILAMGPYTSKRVASTAADRPYGGGDAAGDFAPETLGDTVLVHYWALDERRNWRWIYCNLDSTEAILVDVLD